MASLYRSAAPAARRSFPVGRASCAVTMQWPLGSSSFRQTPFAPATGARSLSVVLQIDRRMGTFRSSLPRRDEHVMNLPGLGDSISEGTVVQWCKAVGDSVSEDEVVAVVETDKISVDVRSTHVGVVVKLFAAVDDAVKVGSPLCTIDGDEAAVVKAKIEAREQEEDANAPPPEVKKPNLDDAFAGAFMAGADFVAPKKKHHEPLIKFLGKRTLLREQQAASLEVPVRHRHSPGALDFSQIVGGAQFGRPTMTEAEMEAVDSGGAENAPQLNYIDGSRWA